MKAVIYARFSSHNQKEESIEQQVYECTQFAERLGHTIVHIYADYAKTGKNDKREQFQQLRRDAKKKQFDLVIAYKSSRIARNMLSALTFLSEMDKLGIEILYAKEDFTNNAAGRFSLRMMMSMNQFYSENLAEDVRRARMDNARNGKPNGMLPYGYKNDDGIKIDPEKAEVVKEIFTRYLDGDKLISIADDLNRRGYKTQAGRPWGKSSFHNILSNKRYTGIYISDGIEIEGGMPQIITKEQFVMAQHKVGLHQIGKSETYVLSGRVMCGCGGKYTGLSAHKDGKIYRYYRCNKCFTAYPCEVLESLVNDAIIKDLFDDETMDWIATNVRASMDLKERNVEEAKAEVSRLIKEREKMYDLYIAAPSDELKQKIKYATDRIDFLKEEIKDLPVITKEDLLQVLRNYKDRSLVADDVRFHLIDNFLTEAIIENDTLHCVFEVGDFRKESLCVSDLVTLIQHDTKWHKGYIVFHYAIPKRIWHGFG